MSTKRKDFVSYGGVENREADNFRGLDTDLGLGLTGMTNRCKHSATIVRVLGGKHLALTVHENIADPA